MRRFFSFTLLEPLLKQDCDLILSIKGKKITPKENSNFFNIFTPKTDPIKLIHRDMQNFSNSIILALETQEKSLDHITQYYFKHAGKQIGPTISLVLAKALNAKTEDLSASPIKPEQMIIAQVIEMIHSSSLIHDDVLDNGQTRRGQISIHTQVGAQSAVLGGDYIVATAYLLCSQAKDMRLIQLLSTIFHDLTIGELIQAESNFINSSNSSNSSNSNNSINSINLDDLLIEYCHKTYFKAASLLSNGCKAIGLYSQQEDKCFEFGKHLGLAYQYIDDVLDFVSSSKTLGKPAMNDLKSGVVTGPVLFAGYFKAEIIEMVQRKFSKPGDLDFAQQAALEYGVEATRRLALMHLNLAIEAVGFVKNPAGLDALVSLVSKVYARQS